MYRILVMSSPLQIIAKDIRTLRIAQGMTQQALADAAGISRTTLVQIEKGSDAQMSSIAMAAKVLGVTLGVLQESPELVKRRQARADNQNKLAASREKHLKIAVQFALDNDEARKLKEDALNMIKLWQDNQLCSPVYIHRWLKVLNAKPLEIARSLSTMDDEWGPAMRQNTPFATSITAP